ncbi:hypothetical protein PtA15_17A247 [Puccinia triticina]|uniref:BZIP domain-containing protein n=1 Tax=Puccinia triticina TaxID=208348 RepID=A0ABY7D9S3_9BASI|nr:uncharacterized protein PtA15_17A247 [Puccinia triticina]WAQ92765.1 hypothetical protein PtA15_17A247 [Puccinia triticina]
MPRQPLADTPGLPPYGQRSSERRKEQNRIAQRQLRERRQQQEAAQTLKLQQQQTEIRRLHHLITELRNENFTLRSQSHNRRRQSVIPISSLSRGLAISHPYPPAATAGRAPTLESNYTKPFLARHSIDNSSLHGAGIDTTNSSHRMYEHRLLKSWGIENQRKPSFASHLRQPAVMSAALYAAQLASDHQASPAPRLETCASQDTNAPANLENKEGLPADSFCRQTHSHEISAGPAGSKTLTSSWLSRKTTPPMRDAGGDWVNSPEKLNQSPQLISTPETENAFFAPPSVNLSSFWPNEPPTCPNNHDGFGDVDYFSPFASSVVPSEFFPASDPPLPSDRIQTRKTSESTNSDSNSVAPTSDEYSSLSCMSTNPARVPFISPDLPSYHIARSLSPTATGSSPEAQVEERNISEGNTAIHFRSPFSEPNDSEITGHPNFGLPLSWIEAKKFNVEALSPLPTHPKPMCLDVSELWGSDF